MSPSKFEIEIDKDIVYEFYPKITRQVSLGFGKIVPTPWDSSSPLLSPSPRPPSIPVPKPPRTHSSILPLANRQPLIPHPNLQTFKRPHLPFFHSFQNCKENRQIGGCVFGGETCIITPESQTFVLKSIKASASSPTKGGSPTMPADQLFPISPNQPGV
jgi:hypothetical protein